MCGYMCVCECLFVYVSLLMPFQSVYMYVCVCVCVSLLAGLPYVPCVCHRRCANSHICEAGSGEGRELFWRVRWLSVCVRERERASVHLCVLVRVCLCVYVCERMNRECVYVCVCV